MNPIQRLYCRAFQLAFRAALPLLPYREPKLLSSLEQIVPVLKGKHIASVLLVLDGGVRDLGLCTPFKNALQHAGIDFAVYEQRTQNPTICDVEAARKAYLACGARAIIAVGGGSAMDCAKVTGARIARPDKPVQKMRGLLHVMRRTPLLICAPTTAGTGSETTLAAVITDSETHHKYPINDFSLIPDYAVLDARFTLGLPPTLTATTGMDALTHAVEAYIGRSTNAYTRRMAEEAVCLIAHALIPAYENGQNIQARRDMLHASYCAGCAFTRSYVGYVHGIAHSLGGQYGIAHGLANAVILPRVLRLYGGACEEKLAHLARIAGLCETDAGDAQAAEEFIRWIEHLVRLFNLPSGFAQIRKEDIPAMANHADKESNPLYPVPRLMDARELEAVYHTLMEA